MERGEIQTDKLKIFILGGNAILTCSNPEKDTHITFHITKSDIRDNLFNVSVLVSPEVYQFMGTINVHPTQLYYHHTTSKIGTDAVSCKTIKWLILKINSLDYQSLGKAKFYHEGKCCVCGRSLTTPESVKNGIGPECSKKYKM